MQIIMTPHESIPESVPPPPVEDVSSKERRERLSEFVRNIYRSTSDPDSKNQIQIEEDEAGSQIATHTAPSNIGDGVLTTSVTPNSPSNVTLNESETRAPRNQKSRTVKALDALLMRGKQKKPSPVIDQNHPQNDSFIESTLVFDGPLESTEKYVNYPPNIDPVGDEASSSVPVFPESSSSDSGTVPRLAEKQYFSPPARPSDRLDIVIRNIGHGHETKAGLIERYNAATREALDILYHPPDNKKSKANWSVMSESNNGNNVAIGRDGWEETLGDEYNHNGYNHLSVELSRQTSNQALATGIMAETKIADYDAEIKYLQRLLPRAKGATKRRIKHDLKDNKNKLKLVENMVKHNGARTEFKADEGKIVVRLVAKPENSENGNRIAVIEHEKFSWTVKPDEQYISAKQVTSMERAVRLLKGEPLYSEGTVEKAKPEVKVQQILTQSRSSIVEAYLLTGQAQEEIERNQQKE